MFVNIAQNAVALLKQWITKRSQGYIYIFFFFSTRRAKRAQSVREINKLPASFFKNKRLSKSHSGRLTHAHAHSLFPLEIKSHLRGCLYTYVYIFFYFTLSFIAPLLCAFPSSTQIKQINILGAVGALMWCLLHDASPQSNPAVAPGCACDLRFERAKGDPAIKMSLLSHSTSR